MLNVTKHLKWTFKTLRSVVICSIRQIRLIWSFSLSCKNSHLSKMTEMAAFFSLVERSGRNASRPIPLAIPEKLICIPHVLWSKAQQGPKEGEVEESHSRYRNVISITGGMSVKAPWPGGNWIGYDSCCTLSKCLLQHNVLVLKKRNKENKFVRLDTAESPKLTFMKA